MSKFSKLDLDAIWERVGGGFRSHVELFARLGLKADRKAGKSKETKRGNDALACEIADRDGRS